MSERQEPTGEIYVNGTPATEEELRLLDGMAEVITDSGEYERCLWYEQVLETGVLRFVKEQQGGDSRRAALTFSVHASGNGETLASLSFRPNHRRIGIISVENPHHGMQALDVLMEASVSPDLAKKECYLAAVLGRELQEAANGPHHREVVTVQDPNGMARGFLDELTEQYAICEALSASMQLERKGLSLKVRSTQVHADLDDIDDEQLDDLERTYIELTTPECRWVYRRLLSGETELYDHTGPLQEPGTGIGLAYTQPLFLAQLNWLAPGGGNVRSMTDILGEVIREDAEDRLSREERF